MKMDTDTFLTKQLTILLLFLCLNNVYLSLGSCDPKTCKLPDCQCPTFQPPNGFSVKETPQIVLLSFDDAVNEKNFDYYQTLLKRNRINANGCPITATFYVSDERRTNYSMINRLFQRGHAIASHSITHRFPPQWWKNESELAYASEIDGQRRIMAFWGRIPYMAITGVRVPFLQIGGNRLYKMMKKRFQIRCFLFNRATEAD